MSNKSYLCRRSYAQAIANGASQAEAARSAGSKARSVDGRSRAGMRLARIPEVQRMIGEARAKNVEATQDEWAACLQRLLAIAHGEESKDSDRIRAISEFGKATGRYAPKEVSHSGEWQRGREAAEKAIAEMTDEGRADFRALLEREIKKRSRDAGPPEPRPV